GICGATTAREATLRGLKVALIDRGDFGHATSANSLKIIHGGLRYLQHGDIKRMRRSIRARSELLRIAPHLVSPLMFVMPTYGHLLKGRETMALALSLNDLIAWDRNRDINDEKFIPRSRTISKTQALHYLPQIDKKGLTGGAIWYDCIAHHTERLTLEFVLAAANSGACTANYVDAKQLMLNGNSVIGIQAYDTIHCKDLQIRSKVVVNASGPWVNKFLKLLPAKPGLNISWAKAVNLMIKINPFNGYAAGFPGKENYNDKGTIIKGGRRLVFCVPWHSGSMVGTTYKRYFGDPEGCRIEEADIAEILNKINFGYPGLKLSLEDVSFYHAGLVPILGNVDDSNQDVKLTTQPLLLDHDKISRIRGIITVNGVKYTTAIELAKDTVNLVLKKLGIEKNEYTGNTLLPGAVNVSFGNDVRSLDDLKYIVDRNTVDQLKRIYGAQYLSVLNLTKTEKRLAETICRGSSAIKAEIVYAIREEMAQHLSDIVMRRTGLANTGNPGSEVVKICAEVMGEELNWETNRRQAEISEVHAALTLL
ncbi:MAG: glycerol-3-phosphate dehydrogenase/oxidase, partial [Nitrospinales bacterium]